MTYRSSTNSTDISVWAIVRYTVLVLLALCIFIFGNPIRMVDSGERLVLKHFRNASSVLEPGPHLIIPFVDSTSHYTVRIQKKSAAVEAQTFDIQEVTGKITANLQVDEDRLLQFYSEQGNLQETIDTIVSPQIQEAAKTVFSKFSAEDTVQQRADLKELFDAELQRRLTPYCLIVVDTAIEDLDFSDAYTTAVEAKQVEEQNVKLEAFKAQQAKLRGEAAANEAAGEAEAIRLKNDALQSGGALVILDRAVRAWADNGSPVPTYLGGNDLVQLFKSVK